MGNLFFVNFYRKIIGKNIEKYKKFYYKENHFVIITYAINNFPKMCISSIISTINKYILLMIKKCKYFF